MKQPLLTEVLIFAPCVREYVLVAQNDVSRASGGGALSRLGAAEAPASGRDGWPVCTGLGERGGGPPAAVRARREGREVPPVEPILPSAPLLSALPFSFPLFSYLFLATYLLHALFNLPLPAFPSLLVRLPLRGMFFLRRCQSLSSHHFHSLCPIFSINIATYCYKTFLFINIHVIASGKYFPKFAIDVDIRNTLLA